MSYKTNDHATIKTLEKSWRRPRFTTKKENSFAVQTTTMQTINTDKLLERLQQQTMQFFDDAVQKWQMMPDQQFSAQPSPSQWSAKQCFAHLNSYGDYYLPAINNAIKLAKDKGSKPAADFTPGWLGNYFTNMMKTEANGHPKKKMKAFKKYSHLNDEEGYKIISTFIDQQEKMLLLLEAAKEVNLETTKVAISIAPFIRLKLGDVFMFIAVHNDRHLKQAERAAG